MADPMNFRTTSRSLLALVLLASAAAAQDKGNSGPVAAKPSPVRFVIEGGFDMGGDDFLELTFTNGDTQTITAGQGGTIAAGLQFMPASMPRFSVSGTVGYKFTTTAAENADIMFTRIPVEIVGRYKLNQDWFVGAGVVRHNSIHLDGDGFVPNADFDAATGATFELGWRWAALTFNAIDYKDAAGTSFSGGSVGVNFRWVSGKK